MVILVSLQLKGNAIETETDLLAIPLVFCAAYRPIPAGPAPITTVGRIAAIRCVRLADFEWTQDAVVISILYGEGEKAVSIFNMPWEPMSGKQSEKPDTAMCFLLFEIICNCMPCRCEIWIMAMFVIGGAIGIALVLNDNDPDSVSTVLSLRMLVLSYI